MWFSDVLIQQERDEMKKTSFELNQMESMEINWLFVAD